MDILQMSIYPPTHSLRSPTAVFRFLGERGVKKSEKNGKSRRPSSHDDVGIVLCSKRKLNKNKQTKILVEMHFVVYSNFSSLDLLSSRS